MSFINHMNSMPNKAPKKSAKKKAVKKVAEIITPKVIEKIIEKPIAPIIKIVEQPNYSPVVIEQQKQTSKIAEQAIASMRDSVNNSQAVMGEIIRLLSIKPVRFDIQRDNKGDMVSLTPIYDKA